ncbi:hypothetical protein DFH07DRAFT_954124 [Mycena maculata]|uniref:Uncharacterized protein n=1 Tax=Mycena maculata TaxID=230809 RepID=A0AAD7JVH0_9AGAR|nr:hypothetical protein DFH07DRAFT_954124 [Mycena maculata]
MRGYGCGGQATRHTIPPPLVPAAHPVPHPHCCPSQPPSQIVSSQIRRGTLTTKPIEASVLAVVSPHCAPATEPPTRVMNIHGTSTCFPFHLTRRVAPAPTLLAAPLSSASPAAGTQGPAVLKIPPCSAQRRRRRSAVGPRTISALPPREIDLQEINSTRSALVSTESVLTVHGRPHGRILFARCSPPRPAFPGHEQIYLTPVAQPGPASALARDAAGSTDLAARHWERQDPFAASVPASSGCAHNGWMKRARTITRPMRMPSALHHCYPLRDAGRSSTIDCPALARAGCGIGAARSFRRSVLVSTRDSTAQICTLILQGHPAEES